MKRIPIYITLLIVLLYLSPCAYSQDSSISEGTDKKSVPGPVNSPNATSLQNMNVDLFHGNLSVNIPLYTLSSKYLSVAISLNYTVPTESHSKTYHPGWVGLGWRLSAGGAITRRIRGTPDEGVCEKDHIFSPPTDPSVVHMEDQFNFNFCGHSGTFFFHKKKLILDSGSDITSLLPIWSSAGRIDGFTIQMPDGNLYTFGVDENAIEKSRTVKGKDPNDPGYQAFFNTAWYLTSIESPEGDVISFQYERGQQICSLSDHSNESKIHAVFRPFYSSREVYYDHIGTYDEERTGTFILPSYLKKITGQGLTEVEFIRTPATEKTYPDSYINKNDTTGYFFPRDLDVISNAVWYKLSSIKIKDLENNRYFKRIDLTYKENANEILSLTKVQEKGIAANGTESSLPAYSFEYAVKDWEVIALSKMVYPTGGYATYNYGKHYYWDAGRNYQGVKGVRIEKVYTYPSAGETPWITEYIYDDGMVGRKEHKKKEAIFEMGTGTGRGSVLWTKTSNYDMSSVFIGAPPAEQVGYGTVSVVKKKGDRQSDYYTYTFTNYDGDLDGYGQRRAYYKVGLLLSVSNSLEKTSYGYDNTNLTDVRYRSTDYMPFRYTDGKTYTKLYEWPYLYLQRNHKPVSITKYAQGSASVVHQETTLTYNYTTMNLIQSETVNVNDGTRYRTEYRYPCDDKSHCSILNTKLPYEVVRYKGDEILSAEVTEYYTFFSGNYEYLRPKKRYVYTDETSNYQPSHFQGGNVARTGKWKEVIAYEYYLDGLLKKETPYGSEPKVYTWDNYNRMQSVTVGDMKTSYTYNIHGITSVTQPNGLSQTTEYNSLGQPVLTRDMDGNILQKIDYSYNLNP